MHLKLIDPLKTLVAAGLAVALIGCGEQPGQVAEDGMQATDKPVAEAPVQLPEAADNPFFAEWDTPFGIPPFDRIGDEPLDLGRDHTGGATAQGNQSC